MPLQPDYPQAGRAQIRISSTLFFQQMCFPEWTDLIDARVEDRLGFGYRELVIVVSHIQLPVVDPVPEIMPVWRRQAPLLFKWQEGDSERPVHGA